MISENLFKTICYILECIISTAIGYYLFKLYPSIGAWCLISIILVIGPDQKDAISLAMARIKANLLGASIGLTLFWIHPINLLMITIGIVIAIIVGQLLKLETATRTAVIAVLIITMHEPGQHFWDVVIERTIAVITGCLVGVVLTYLFHIIILKSKGKFFQAEKIQT